MLNSSDSLEGALVAAHHDMHTRFPVTETRGDPQGVIGYVNFKDIVSCLRLSPNEPSLRGILRPLSSYEASLTVAACLEQQIRNHNHIALVRDRDGTVLGMVTLEDILEELVGEIHDEYDRLPAHVSPAGDGWIAGGNATLTYLKAATGIELPVVDDKPAKTLNEWVVANLGRPPQGGDEVKVDSVRILVRKVRRQLLQEALITRRAPVPSEAHARPSVGL
jgi:putative hemolysin